MPRRDYVLEKALVFLASLTDRTQVVKERKNLIERNVADQEIYHLYAWTLTIETIYCKYETDDMNA